METSFSGSAKYRGTDGTEIGTFSSILRPEGVLYGEGQGVITSKDGEVATWTGSGIGRFTGQGKIRFHGPLFYRTLSTGKLAFLNNLVGVCETQIDENQNSHTKSGSGNDSKESSFLKKIPGSLFPEIFT